jgi:hypothetical protein
MSYHNPSVMAGLGPATHVLHCSAKDVDGRPLPAMTVGWKERSQWPTICSPT